jgi:hypothetical protein
MTVIDPTRYGPYPPRPRSHWLRNTLITVAVVIGVCTIANIARLAVAGSLANNTGSSNNAAVADAQDSNAPVAAHTVPGLGQAVRDGQFEFVVNGVSCGHATVDNGWLHATAKGQYCVVDLSVRNIGSQDRRFADGAQIGFGPQGQRYAADTGAGVVANGNGDAIWNVVNPGVSLRVKVVYDMPVGGTIAQLVLHDSPFSGGVTVQVS